MYWCVSFWKRGKLCCFCKKSGRDPALAPWLIRRQNLSLGNLQISITVLLYSEIIEKDKRSVKNVRIWGAASGGTWARRRADGDALHWWHNQSEEEAILRGRSSGAHGAVPLMKKPCLPILLCSLPTSCVASHSLTSDLLPSSSRLVVFKCSFSSNPHKTPCLNCFNLQVCLLLIPNSLAVNQTCSRHALEARPERLKQQANGMDSGKQVHRNFWIILYKPESGIF